MSALAMILTAAIVVPGDVPQKVSMEMVETLDLSGEWECAVSSPAIEPELSVLLSYKGGKLTVMSLDSTERIELPFELVAQGNGKCHWRIAEQRIAGGRMPAEEGLGIYQWRGQQLVLCINDKLPSAFRKEDGLLLILHRVKPRK